MRQKQPELFAVAKDDPNIELIVRLLKDTSPRPSPQSGQGEERGWRTARDILIAVCREDNESGRRWVRAIAEASGGRIAGGQRGYKLVTEMTKEEFDHWRNWMKSQADKMTRRILEADRVFFKRQPVETGAGIL